jgi:hypothetical protein
MSYTRTAIATATIVMSIFAAGPGTRPASASGGFAGIMPPDHRAHSHSPSLQTPAVPVEEGRIFTTTIHTETYAQHVMALGALAEMAAAGFAMPPVTIHIHSDKDGCNQLNGYFVQREGENIVHSCGNRWTLIHELAHAWDINTLDDETRHEFMHHQGLDSWHHESWSKDAGEHLASIVAWALDGARPSRIGYYDDEHLAEAYEMATGMPIPQDEEADRVHAASSGVATATITEPAPPQ